MLFVFSGSFPPSKFAVKIPFFLTVCNIILVVVYWLLQNLCTVARGLTGHQMESQNTWNYLASFPDLLRLQLLMACKQSVRPTGYAVSILAMQCLYCMRSKTGGREGLGTSRGRLIVLQSVPIMLKTLANFLALCTTLTSFSSVEQVGRFSLVPECDGAFANLPLQH